MEWSKIDFDVTSLRVSILPSKVQILTSKVQILTFTPRKGEL